MAQKVGYWQDNVVFEEGPFVLVNANGWRVEVEMKDHYCPVLPDTSIYELKRDLGWPSGKTWDLSLAERICDRLNELVREGRIKLVGRQWVVA